MRQRDLIAQCAAPASVVRAVVRQIGGWEEFNGYATDIARYGADRGFRGFTYYRETVAFTRRNLPALREMVQDTAREFGKDVGGFLAGFSCLNGWSSDECAEAFYSGKGEAAQAVYNALAWYAAEEVARAYDDAR